MATHIQQGSMTLPQQLARMDAGRLRRERHRRLRAELVPDFGRHPGGHRQIASDDAVGDLDVDLAGVAILHVSLLGVSVAWVRSSLP